MYSETKNTVTFFVPGFGTTDTGKRFTGTISDCRKNMDGTTTYDYWPAHFVGKAYQKRDVLQNKTMIRLLKWSVANPYSKKTSRTMPALTVFDFEVYERPGTEKES